MIYEIKSRVDLPCLSMAGFKMYLGYRMKGIIKETFFQVELESLDELERFQKTIGKPINLNENVITIGELPE